MAVLCYPAAAFGQSRSEPATEPGRVQELGDTFPGVPVDVDLRLLPAAQVWQPGDPIWEIPRRDPGDGAPVVTTPSRLDPLVERQRQLRAPGVSLLEVLNFEGNSSTANPNDPTGDVGANYFVQAINGSGGSAVSVYAKQDGSLVSGPFALDSLAPPGECDNGRGDPIVLYDHLAERWLLTEFSTSGNKLCFYTSRTADPIAGGWCAYEFQDSSFPDYPKYGAWPDLYLATANQGNAPPAYAFDRLNMLSPDGVSCPTARATQKVTASGLPGLGFEALTPVDLDGPAPPAGAPAYFLRHRDSELHDDPDPGPLPAPPPSQSGSDTLEMWALDVDFDDADNTTFVQLPNVVIADFDSNLCPPLSFFSCVPQPSGPALDPLLEVVMYRASYRNFGSHETIVGVLQTDVGDFEDHAGERWFELRKSGGGDWTRHQEGTYSPDNEHRFMGAIAMDAAGNILLAFNVSSEIVHPSLRYTGRAATDPPGVLTVPEVDLAVGAASNSSIRYGDYNQMGVDPIDDCTFWFLGMYNPGAKGVRIGAVRFPSCGLFSDGFESGDTTAWSVP